LGYIICDDIYMVTMGNGWYNIIFKSIYRGVYIYVREGATNHRR
jgi:hypothetical protein